MQSHASKSPKEKNNISCEEKTKCAKLARVCVCVKASISVGLQRFISKVVTF